MAADAGPNILRAVAVADTIDVGIASVANIQTDKDAAAGRRSIMSQCKGNLHFEMHKNKFHRDGTR